MFWTEPTITATVMGTICRYLIQVLSSSLELVVKSGLPGACVDVGITKKVAGSDDEVPLLAIEVKSFWALDDDCVSQFIPADEFANKNLFKQVRATPDAAVGLDGFRKKFIHAIAQLFAYMDAARLHYGVLTTYNYTWFVNRSGVRQLDISAAYRHDSTNDTVLQVLARLIIDSSRLPPYQYRAPFTNDNKVVSGESQIITRSMAMSTTTNKRATRSETKKGNPSKKRARQSPTTRGTTRALSAKFDRFINLVMNAPTKAVGEGRTGIVTRAMLPNGKSYVVKSVDVYKQYHMIRELENELTVYERLKSLQGQCIPHCVHDTVLFRANIAFLIFSYEGTQITDKMVPDLPLCARKQAVCDLMQINDLGIMHNDIVLRNLVWNGERQRIVFIDFGNSTLIEEEDEKKREGEIKLLKELLGVTSSLS
jgi:tRNA A-37 threonylcarbamoyl transferase component Bud32